MQKDFKHHKTLKKNLGAWELAISKQLIGKTKFISDSFAIFDPMSSWLMPNHTDWQAYKQ